MSAHTSAAIIVSCLAAVIIVLIICVQRGVQHNRTCIRDETIAAIQAGLSVIPPAQTHGPSYKR